MCISIFFFGSFFFFFVFVGCTDYQALGHKGLLDTQTSFIMQILYLSRLVLVQLAFKFKSCRFLFTKNADKVCMFCFLILPSVFVFYCICNIRSFSKRRTDSKENDFFFLNLTIIDCIVGGLFKNRVKFVSANSFVCGSYVSLGTFLNRFPLHTKRREHSIFLISRRSP